MKVLMIAFSLMLSHVALADQCAAMSSRVAKKAEKRLKKLLKDEKPVLFHCATCENDGYAIESVRQVEIVDTGIADYEKAIKVNYKSVDLAYTYVWVGAGKYRNLAMLVGCPADSVPEFIKF